MSSRGSALSGSFADLSFPDLLTLLSATRQRGILTIYGRIPGLVAFEEGEVTVAVSESGPNLREVLVGSGLTTREGWDEAEAALARGTSVTETLLAQGADPVRVRHVLHDNTVGAVFELMLPSDDTFSFEPGDTHPIGTMFRFPVERLLADAERRVEAWKVIAEAIPSTSMVMRLARALPTPTLTVSADEWHVLSRIDGRSSIADIIRTLGMSAFAVCGVLHRLLQLGIVEPVEDA